MSAPSSDLQSKENKFFCWLITHSHLTFLYFMKVHHWPNSWNVTCSSYGRFICIKSNLLIFKNKIPRSPWYRADHHQQNKKKSLHKTFSHSISIPLAVILNHRGWYIIRITNRCILTRLWISTSSTTRTSISRWVIRIRTIARIWCNLVANNLLHNLGIR